MLLKFRKGSQRKTEAYEVTIFGVTAYISYETVIAFSSPGIGSYRLKNTWGPTTGKHFVEMSCGDFDVLEPDEFETVFDEALIANVIKNMGQEVLRSEVARRVARKLETGEDT